MIWRQMGARRTWVEFPRDLSAPWTLAFARCSPRSESHCWSDEQRWWGASCSEGEDNKDSKYRADHMPSITSANQTQVYTTLQPFPLRVPCGVNLYVYITQWQFYSLWRATPAYTFKHVQCTVYMHSLYRQTDHRQVNICCQFPENYPTQPLIGIVYHVLRYERRAVPLMSQNCAKGCFHFTE